jgi:hypothetical protein
VLGVALLSLGAAGLPRVADAIGEDPAAEVAAAVRSLGPPGLLWGRLVVEEESPLGAWTPVGGVEVTLYPATPTLVAELERIRQSARASGAQYESAVARVQAALAAHQGRIDGKSPETMGSDGALPAEPPVLPPSRPAVGKGVQAGAGATPGARAKGGTVPALIRGAAPVAEPPAHPWRQETDPSGLFAFGALPSGDWLVVAIQISAYQGEKLRGAPRARTPSLGLSYLPRAQGPAKEAEVWVVRVRVGPAERVGLEITDRARWLVGPVR